MRRRGPFAGGVGMLALLVLIGVLAIALLGPIDVRVGNDGGAQETAAPTAAPGASQQPAPSGPLVVSFQATARPGAGSAPGAAASGAMDAVAVVDRVAPAVVTVVNRQRNRGFFGGEDVQQQGIGTGFIVDEAGNIVTNWHVVEGGNDFQVVFVDGEEREAELVGSDETSDLAVVRIEGDLPATVLLGDSDALKVGQPVLALGSPLGEFTNTVTQGIVSALGRDFPRQPDSSSIYTNLIQHDAAINPGNSGGPLFNAAGEVVGVNTLGLPQAQGLFFAIPANTVREITTALIDEGRVRYPVLGILDPFITINDQIASQNDLPVDHGFYFQEVAPDGPAEQAGLQGGDIIVAIDGQRIDQGNSFFELLFAHEPGDTVGVTAQRGDEELEFEVTLGERSSTNE